MTTNYWFLILLEGLFIFILGLFAISQPLIATLSVEFLIGALLIAVGVAQGIRALVHWNDPRSLTTLIGGIFALIAGVLLLVYPLTGAMTLTLLITVFLVLDGITKVVNAFQFRSVQGWGWLLFSGLVSLTLAGLIFSGWPSSATWLIGLYVGIYLLFLGFSLMTLAFYLKKQIPS
jgi:uncharacterized membrane protein HdeD (DUF308 family)